MNRWLSRTLIALIGFYVAPLATIAAEPLVEEFLIEGRLAEGDRELKSHLRMRPGDDECRFGLGTLQFLRAIEHLGQSLHHYGAVGSNSLVGRQIPFIRLAVSANPSPAKVRYEDFRQMIQQLIDDLKVAADTLAPLKDRQIKLPLHFAMISLDTNGNGKTEEGEALWRVYSSLNAGLRIENQINNPITAQHFVIGFDFGDALWLHGYCHLLSAIGEALLAYDEQEFFDMLAPQLFDNPASVSIPPGLLRRPENQSWNPSQFADAIAAIHLSRFPLKEPHRMKAALAHLHEVIRLSRESWQALQAETDDDQEWLPNSRQTGVIPNVRATAPMITSWHKFLDEAEDLLKGKKLVPHWRLNERFGVNLRRVFEEPRDFDVVLWAHGIAAVPYLEPGPQSSPETWSQLERVFGGQFIGFAFWFN